MNVVGLCIICNREICDVDDYFAIGGIIYNGIIHNNPCAEYVKKENEKITDWWERLKNSHSLYRTDEYIHLAVKDLQNI